MKKYNFVCVQTIFNERMDTKKLRQKILDLAIHGKLVPQNPNDEPASVLLERIRAEKERLIAEGKIKRSKRSATSDTSHYKNEVPFEVPENWEWTTIGELCSFLSRGKSPKYSEERKYPVFAQKCNLYDGDISLEKARFLDPKTISKWSDEYKLIDGDILVNSTGTGTVGRTRLFHSDVLGDYPFVVPDSHVSVVRSFEEIESKFVLAFLSSDYGQTYIEDNLAGSTNQKELYIGVLDNMQFPLPPHEEQFRIVTTVDKWFSLIDTLESAKEDLQTSITQAKSKILDLAIHGKLVPQDPNDEPASELLKRINPKAVACCDNPHYENVPFDIPSSWAWCKVRDVADVARGGSPRPIKQYLTDSPDGINWIKIGDAEEGSKYITKTTERIITEGVKKSRYVKVGDFLLTNSMSFGKPYILATEGCIHDGWLVISPIDGVYDKNFLYYLLSSSFAYNQFSEKAGGAVVSNLNKDKVADSLFPLPPLAEQKRIVDMVEELYSSLKAIANTLK